MILRQPCVAGRFYPLRELDLRAELQSYVRPVPNPKRVLGVLAPHAGYMYSGAVAGMVYSRIQVPNSIVILCPNHTGTPVDFSVWAQGQWKTPLGLVSVDELLARQILAVCPQAKEDHSAHQREHSGEVQVPFLQFINPQTQIVPVVLSVSSLTHLKTFGQGLARAIQASAREILIVASSDMSHYEPHDMAKMRDRLAIDQMLKMDESGLWQTVNEHRISMCGYGPATAMLAAVKALGANHAELVQYSTSGDVSRDYDQVVGYAGMIFY